MKISNFLKLFVCCVMIAMLGFTGHVRSEQTEPTTLEPIGKDDPFEEVTPIVEAKKKIVQRFTGTQENVEVIPDLFVETVMLKFLRASNLEPAVTNLNSAYGTIAVDKETNSLIICDSADKVAMITDQIRKADQMPKQILVEVVIVDVQLNDDTEIGVDWEHFPRFDEDGKLLASGRRGDTENYTQALTTLTTGATFSFIHDGIQGTIHALQTVRNVEILASPRVLVVSGQEAFIKTIEEIPYTEQTQTSGGGAGVGGSSLAMTSTEFKEAGITLLVKATLTDEGKILVGIDAEQSVNVGVDESLGGSKVPIVDRRNANTMLLMDDGQVVVMGGLRKTETTIKKSKVPLLGDLPLIGVLFSNEQEEIKNSELLILISPHVYKDQMLTEHEKARFNEAIGLESIEFPDHPRKEYKALVETFDGLSLEK